MRLQDTDLPLRPGFGTAGTAIKLRTNFFPVKVPKGPLFEYDVKITPEVAVKRVKRRIFQLAEQTPGWASNGLKGCVAHDHAAKLIAAKALPQPLEIVVPFSDEEAEIPAKPKGGPKVSKKGGKPTPKEYKLSLKFIQQLETQSLVSYLNGQPQYRGYDVLPIIAALNLILAAYPNRSSAGGVMVGRNKFFNPSPEEPAVSIGGGLEAWRGFYSSVRPAHKTLMVNVNVCTTAFYAPGNLADSMWAFSQGNNTRIGGFVRGVRVKTKHLGQMKTVKGVHQKSARQFTFQAEGMGTISVEEYFKKKYGITLQYPDQVLVDVGGGGGKANLLPPELCEILPNQAFRGKLNDDHTSEMIKVACRFPNVNAAAIVGRGIRELGYVGKNETLEAFGTAVGNELAVVPGRILPKPDLKYAKSNAAIDDRASWNLRDVKFAQAGRFNEWACLLIQDNGRDEFEGENDPQLQQVLDGFQRMCSKSGVNFPKKKARIFSVKLPEKSKNDPIRGAAVNSIRDKLREMRPKPDFLLVILANGDRHVYAGLKHQADVQADMTTICVQVQKLRKEKGQPQYFANVALKLNTKTGGVNHTLDPRHTAQLRQRPTMMVGIDVTHPGFGTVKHTPSIAAVVASIDQHFGQFPCSLRMQESKKEMVTDLAEMMIERLKAFQAASNVLPDRIIVYRDGVSEGQFNIVIQDEMPEIKKAFRAFDKQQPYMPKLTIVVCGKRHHTRFFPTDPQHAAGDGNPKPGTVVDRGVTAVYEFDFFLQAHGGLQGTTRPTHYYVVHDEIGFQADQLQTLTNDVSFLFARATKAVSLVSPAYYADLACERGRCYLHPLLQGVTSLRPPTGASEPTETQVWDEAKRLWGPGPGASIKKTMFYL
ncbi:argonaute-like protein [Phanerochaete sordida]|uniref:Argonaute-like protein n=1 Tax=Phanerochaete sordida TaxID=48140 RepID=A0A9P3G136_9APHY|nr:argonaute-like protein [Phanerochaete sordida]